MPGTVKSSYTLNSTPNAAHDVLVELEKRGLIDAVVTQIRGRDKSKPVMFENMFNQIHAPEQVLALGTTTYDDGVIRIGNDGTHGLFSRFDWSAPAAR